MNLRKILLHPLLIIFLFGIILISGEHIGGPFLMYLLLGLQVLAVHSLIGLTGILMIVISLFTKSKIGNAAVHTYLRMIGTLLMWISLLIFYYLDKSHYNYGTFEQVIPMTTIAVFIIFSALFFTLQVKSLGQISQP